MSKEKIKEMIRPIIREIMSEAYPTDKDFEFIANQLINNWINMSKLQMFNNLYKKTKINPKELSKLVGDWYKDSKIRNEISLAKKKDIKRWLETYLTQHMKIESLRGGAQSVMMQGMTGDRMGELNLDDEDEDLKEFSMTHDSLNMVKKDFINFINTEHKKLGNVDKRDTMDMIRMIFKQLTTRDL